MNNKKYSHAQNFLYSASYLSELVIDQIGDKIIVLNADLNIVLINNAAESWLQYKNHQVLNQPLISLLPDSVKPGKQSMLERVLHGELLTIKEEIGNLYFEWRLSPLHEKNGKLIGVLCIIGDITQKIQNEFQIGALNRELTEKELLLNNRAKLAETIIDSSNDLIVVLDRNFTYCAANKAFLKFCNKINGEIIGKNIMECSPFINNAEIISQIRQAFEGTSFTLKKFSFPSEVGVYNILITPLSYHEFIYGVMIIAHDITQVTEQAQQILSTNELLSQKNIEIKTTNNLLQSIFNSTKDFIAIYDNQLCFQDVNGSFLSYLNTDKESLLGKQLLDIYPQIKHHEIYDRITKALEGESQLLSNYKFLHKEGFGRISIIPLKNDNNEVEKIIIISQEQ